MYANTEAAQTVVNRMEAYGVQHDGEVVTQEYHQGVSYDNQMSLAEVAKRGGRITRVRILKEGGRCDISYIHATLADGTTVPLYLDMPSSGVGLWFREVKGEFIAWAKEQGVFAKGLGLLDESNWAVLHG